MSLVGLYTSLSGIRAARVGMDVTSHNVANANTEGYTRQRVDLATTYPSQTAVGKIGTGVTVADITRIRDSFLDQRVRSDLAAGGELDVRADLLARTEAVLGEPDSGLTHELNELWAAFEELGLRPDDGATRRQVVSSLESLEARVKSISGDLQVLADDTATGLAQAVKDVNGLFQRIADLNGDILDAQTGPGVPNDLMDQRDLLVDEVSRTIGARVTIGDDGTARVSVAGMSVVSGTNAQELALYDPAVHGAMGNPCGIMHPSGTAVNTGGEIAGMQGFLQTDLPDQVQDLHAVVARLSTALNDQHDDGVDQNGVAGGAIFSYRDITDVPPNPGAIGSSLDLQLFDPGTNVRDPALLAAAAMGGGTHDGSNAEKLAALRTDIPAGESASIDEALRSFVTELAATVQSTDRQARGQRTLTRAAESAREGMHGVSLDEEMVNMLSHQRALEASSRVMSAVDQALDVLINRTGIVGR